LSDLCELQILCANSKELEQELDCVSCRDRYFRVVGIDSLDPHNCIERYDKLALQFGGRLCKFVGTKKQRKESDIYNVPWNVVLVPDSEKMTGVSYRIISVFARLNVNWNFWFFLCISKLSLSESAPFSPKMAAGDVRIADCASRSEYANPGAGSVVLDFSSLNNAKFVRYSISS
jgi:hypothetical protein